MRSFPDFAVNKTGASRSESHAVVARGRYLVGTLAVGGAFFIIGMAEPANAAPSESSTVLGAPAPKTSSKPAAKAPARTKVDTAKVYKIAAGDSLSSIAAKFSVSVPSLATLNGINNYNFIVAGKDLLIPAASATTPAAATTKVTSTPAPKAAVSAKTTKAAATVSVGKSSAGQSLPNELKGSPRAALNSQFDSAAAAYKVPNELLKAITYQESGWNNSKVSSTGAIGIGQLMPATSEFVNTQLLTKPLNPKVPGDNIKMSAAFLSYLLDETNGDQTLATAAYYQGLGAVRNIGLYDDTKQYIQSVGALRANFF